MESQRNPSPGFDLLAADDPRPSPESFAREIDALLPEQIFLDNGRFAVCCATAEQIPTVLQEIGRLREVTFRQAGEGTGKDVDLDGFDAYYGHLFLWNRARRELVGAYRLGPAAEIMETRGVEGLYTSTLFHFAPELIGELEHAVELGRTFIRVEYQRQVESLHMLWSGLGVYLRRRRVPRFTFFGPASISNTYRHESQMLIAAYIKRSHFYPELSRWVRGVSPEEIDETRAADISGISALDAAVRAIEGTPAGIPVLLKRYLQLGSLFLGFNRDANFSNVLDCLVWLDLRRASPKRIAIYGGPEFAAWIKREGAPAPVSRR